MRLSKIWRLGRDCLVALCQLSVALLGWVLGYPLTRFIPRDPHLTVVIGRRGPVFADNSKYFYLFASQVKRESGRVVFLSNEAALVREIADAGGEAMLHPSMHSLFLVLRCGRVVVDMAEWFDSGVYPCSRGAQTIQLWHGAPLKHIELDLHRARMRSLSAGLRQLLALQKALLGRYPVYDVVVATSQAFINQAFSRSFSTRAFVATGYPRNDILLQWPEQGSLAERLVWINVDRAAIASVQSAHEEGRKVVLYAPTFRRDMASPFEHEIDLVRLSEFAGRHDLLIVIKLHPFMHGLHQVNRYPNLIEYAPLADIYPLMAQSDLLITDYSSIYLDYLLLDRPMVFFAYDLEHYVSRDRPLYFPYDSMTPGARCSTQTELEAVLSAILDEGCRDAYQDQRAVVRGLTHEHLDGGSVARLLEELGHQDSRAVRSR